MTRAYPIPSHLEPSKALLLVQDLFSIFDYRWATVNHESYSIKVSADPLVFKVIEPAVKFELHERKGCTCKPCRNLAEVCS